MPAITMNIQLDVTILIDGEERTSRETFRACGALFVRYERKRSRGVENGYATATEWNEWLFRGRIVEEFRQPRTRSA